MPSTTNVTDTFGFNAADQMTSVSDSQRLDAVLRDLHPRQQRPARVATARRRRTSRTTSTRRSTSSATPGSGRRNACSSPPASSYPYAFDNADNLTTMENAGHGGTNTQQFNNADELCWTVSGASGNACSSAPGGRDDVQLRRPRQPDEQVPSGGSATCTAYDQADPPDQRQDRNGIVMHEPDHRRNLCLRRRRHEGEQDRVGTTTQYTWDGAGGNLLQEKAGSTKTSYIYGPGGLPVEQIVGSTTTYLHHDQTRLHRPRDRFGRRHGHRDHDNL